MPIMPMGFVLNLPDRDLGTSITARPLGLFGTRPNRDPGMLT
jgi:hypothetical protein